MFYNYIDLYLQPYHIFSIYTLIVKRFMQFGSLSSVVYIITQPYTEHANHGPSVATILKTNGNFLLFNAFESKTKIRNGMEFCSLCNMAFARRSSIDAAFWDELLIIHVPTDCQCLSLCLEYSLPSPELISLRKKNRPINFVLFSDIFLQQNETQLANVFIPIAQVTAVRSYVIGKRTQRKCNFWLSH